jgi:hypothetical protein
LKLNPLANDPAKELDALARLTRRHTRRLQRKEPLLRAFLKHANLSFRLV